VSPGLRVVIRAAGPDDILAVAALERDALGPDAWSEALLEDGVTGRIPTTLFFVANPSSVEHAETSIVGYAAISVVADIAELQRIAVSATHRRTGVASALLAHVEHEATTRHADRILLEVRDDNAGALAFYARQGFTELDRRPRYYADGTTAIVLVRDVREISDGDT
jgi:[ribosomal protein S18]-alanine N-acetyltransferase